MEQKREMENVNNRREEKNENYTDQIKNAGVKIYNILTKKNMKQMQTISTQI